MQLNIQEKKKNKIELLDVDQKLMVKDHGIGIESR